MKKYYLLIICLIVFCVILSACSSAPNSPIKYQRKLEKYIKPLEDIKNEKQPVGGMVDLSEGPKLNYNAKFGPKELNFDIKIVNPY